MPKKKPLVIYFRVGQVERWSKSKRSYVWHDGYSEKPDGSMYPWLTKAEARETEARYDRRVEFKERNER